MAKNKKKKKHRLFWFIVKMQIVLMLAVVAVFCIYSYGGYAEQVQVIRQEAIKLVRESNEHTFVPSQTSVIYDAEISIVNCHNFQVGSVSKLTDCVMMLSNIDSEQMLAEQIVKATDRVLAGKMYSGLMEKDIRKILIVDRDIVIEVGDGLVSETTKTYQIRFGHIS
jgi:hypothetical protein